MNGVTGVTGAGAPTSPRVALAVGAAVATLVVSAGVAVAVTRAHRDAPVALPPVCRDNPGSAGGSLPNGPAIDKALGANGGGSSGSSRLLGRGAAGLLGSGTAGELGGRAQALLGGAEQTAAGGGSGAGGGGTGGAAGSGQGSGSGQSGAGSGSGSGGGSGAGAGSGGGAGGGGGGTGGGTAGGTETGPGSGSGPLLAPGAGPDAAGVPQPVTPRLPPPKVDPPQPPAQSTTRHASPVLVGLFLALVALVAALVAGRLLARRREADPALPDATGLSAADADQRAAAALAAADHDAALRWTFVAGLLRLDDAGVLAYDPARTTRECARRLRSARFRNLARGFDLVAYGGRHASAGDVTAARSSWQALLAEVAPGALPRPAASRAPLPV